MATGFLQVRVTTQILLPLEGAQVLVWDGETSRFLADKTVYTDRNGVSPSIELETVPKAFSLDEFSDVFPYKTYNIVVKIKNYIRSEIIGINIFEGQTTVKYIDLLARPTDFGSDYEIDFRKEEINKLCQDVPYDKTGSSRVLQKVVIPEKIVVHLGAPNESASNVEVPFRTYLKSVAASEIYPTWPEQALRANIYAQISFALNRIFTEWYPSRGYNFNITSSPSYDQKYVHNRSTFESTDEIVDEIFNEYIVKVGRIDPFFAEYCDGKNVTCPGMSQWGSKSDAERGMSAVSILRKYYGNSINITESNNIVAIPVSYPGKALREGDVGENVRTIQAQLNRIADDYPAITKVSANGIFGADTTEAVKKFQKIFNITSDGIVGKTTWYKISYIYVSVKKLAQLTSEGESIKDGFYPGVIVKQGDTGLNVQIIQFYLNQTAVYVNTIPPVTIDGVFGPSTKNAVIKFQEFFNLTPDGIVGKLTWDKMYDIYQGIRDEVDVPQETPPQQDSYPGTPLKVGSSGDDVAKIQNWLNGIGRTYTSIPFLNVDGKFGALTKTAVTEYQKLFSLTADGIVGPATWNSIYSTWQNLAAEGQV